MNVNLEEGLKILLYESRRIRMNQKNILKLAKPITNTWAAQSHLESMILLQDNAQCWMFDNYINLLGSWDYQRKKCSLGFIPFSNPTLHDITLSAWIKCPFIEFAQLSHYYVKSEYEDILEFVFYAIDAGYYLFMELYQAVLPKRTNLKYQLTFIYGYDKEKKTIYVADHYDNGKYLIAEIGFLEFVKSYKIAYWDTEEENLLESSKEIVREKKLITVAKQKDFKYEFNKEWFKYQLIDYLDATYRLHGISPIPEQAYHIRYFGINGYDLLNYFLCELVNDEGIWRDWRSFTLLSDHKKLLLKRVEFLNENRICMITNEEIKKYNELYRSAQIIQNLFLKYAISSSKDVVGKMKKILLEMKSVEEEILTSLYYKL